MSDVTAETAKEIGLSNIIALIWDCDKTLIDRYMQDPIFANYQIDSHDFWTEVNTAPERLEAKGTRVNHDTYYLKLLITPLSASIIHCQIVPEIIGGSSHGTRNAPRKAAESLKF